MSMWELIRKTEASIARADHAGDQTDAARGRFSIG